MPPIIEKMKNQISGKNAVLLAVILILILIIVVIWLLNYRSEENMELEVYVPAPEVSMEIGDVGDIEDGESLEEINPSAVSDSIRPLDLPIPDNIFNTAGTILEIRGNSLVIRGNGSNFDDQVNRDLVVIIDEDTEVNGSRGNLEIFKDTLNIGDRVAIESVYNIHGKTEFLAKYINTIIE